MKIIVNGGTKGIGKEVTIKLAESAENTIVVTGRSIPELKSIAGRYENIYNTPQKSDHWLSLVKTVTLTVDYESKKKKIYRGL